MSRSGRALRVSRHILWKLQQWLIELEFNLILSWWVVVSRWRVFSSLSATSWKTWPQKTYRGSSLWASTSAIINLLVISFVQLTTSLTNLLMKFDYLSKIIHSKLSSKAQSRLSTFESITQPSNHPLETRKKWKSPLNIWYRKVITNVNDLKALALNQKT